MKESIAIAVVVVFAAISLHHLWPNEVNLDFAFGYAWAVIVMGFWKWRESKKQQSGKKQGEGANV